MLAILFKDKKPHLCSFEEYIGNPTFQVQSKFYAYITLLASTIHFSESYPTDSYLHYVLSAFQTTVTKRMQRLRKNSEEHPIGVPAATETVSRTPWMALLENDNNVMQTEKQQNKIIEVIIWGPKGHGHNSSQEEWCAALEIMTFCVHPWTCLTMFV